MNFPRSLSTWLAFKIDCLPVTNGEFFEFVTVGAYADPRYWRPEDWHWKELEHKQHPTCWVKQTDCWFYRAMFDILPLEQVASWPVYVSLAEARAFAKWRGQRLPTEAEYQRAAYYGPSERESTYPWGDGEPSSRARQLRLCRVVGPSGRISSRRSEPLGGAGAHRQRLGVDRHTVRAAARIHAIHDDAIRTIQKIFSTASILSSRARHGPPTSQTFAAKLS